MFRRREDGTEELINENEEATIAPAPAGATAATPIKPQTPSVPVTPTPAAAAAGLQPSQSFRPAPPQAAMAAASRSASAMAPAMPSPAASEPVRSAAMPVNRPNAKRVLTVGPDIQMKGEISSCDRVVIEGVVDATMKDVHTVELTETGTLKGTAEVEDAEISGSFEGDLVVRGKLTLHSSGRVKGNVTYGEIEIQRGGQISGNIRNVSDAKATAAAVPLQGNKAKAA